MPDRYTQDNFYRKGAFHCSFQVEPVEPDANLDEEARRRALQQLLLALRDEAGLKVSSFVDVDDATELAEPLEPQDDDQDASAQDDEPDLSRAQLVDLSHDLSHDLSRATAEFVLYNKLGVTSLGKLRKFMEAHLMGDVQPRVVLVDPETDQKFRCSNFTIQYLFYDFVAHVPPDDWERLKELLAQEDRGYRELTQAAKRVTEARLWRDVRSNQSSFIYRGHVYHEWK